jgi:putative sigma-54 modulation protein
MTKIELRGSNLPISEALREHLTRKLDFVLRRLGEHVDRIIVRIVDINGPKGGLDKRCRIIARLSPAGIVVVEATDADSYVAVSHAATRMEERIARAVTRRRPRPPAARRGARRQWQEALGPIANGATEGERS